MLYTGTILWVIIPPKQPDLKKMYKQQLWEVNDITVAEEKGVFSSTFTYHYENAEYKLAFRETKPSYFQVTIIRDGENTGNAYLYKFTMKDEILFKGIWTEYFNPLAHDTYIHLKPKTD